MKTQTTKLYCNDAAGMYSSVLNACSFLAHLGLSFSVDRLCVNKFIVSSRPNPYRLADSFETYIYEIYF